MHGNVWEWCEDDWQENYINAPINGSALISQTDIKLLRGGSWNLIPDVCRSAYRNLNILDDSSNAIGFRVVCSGAART
jgi:formylglycine-generating enzyme required for sulfatase activity